MGGIYAYINFRISNISFSKLVNNLEKNNFGKNETILSNGRLKNCDFLPHYSGISYAKFGKNGEFDRIVYSQNEFKYTENALRVEAGLPVRSVYNHN